MRAHLLHPGQGSEAAAASTFFSFTLYSVQHVGSSAQEGGTRNKIETRLCSCTSCSTWTLSGATMLRLPESGLNHRLKVVVALARMKGPLPVGDLRSPQAFACATRPENFVAAKCSGYIASYNYHGGTEQTLLHRGFKAV